MHFYTSQGFYTFENHIFALSLVQLEGVKLFAQVNFKKLIMTKNI